MPLPTLPQHNTFLLLCQPACLPSQLAAHWLLQTQSARRILRLPAASFSEPDPAHCAPSHIFDPPLPPSIRLSIGVDQTSITACVCLLQEHDPAQRPFSLLRLLGFRAWKPEQPAAGAAGHRQTQVVARIRVGAQDSALLAATDHLTGKHSSHTVVLRPSCRKRAQRPRVQARPTRGSPAAMRLQ